MRQLNVVSTEFTVVSTAIALIAVAALIVVGCTPGAPRAAGKGVPGTTRYRVVLYAGHVIVGSYGGLDVRPQATIAGVHFRTADGRWIEWIGAALIEEE